MGHLTPSNPTRLQHNRAIAWTSYDSEIIASNGSGGPSLGDCVTDHSPGGSSVTAVIWIDGIRLL